MRTRSSVLFAFVALAGAGWLDLRMSDRLLGTPYDVAYVPNGSVARIVSLGHRTALSDLYWLSAVQYVGEPKADARGWSKLHPLVDLVTDLDPRHGYAYQTAGIVLSAVGRLDESDRILDKGIARGPPYWTFPYYRSFNAWFYRGDYATAAAYARMAAERPGASPNLSQLALSLSSKSGTAEEALAMLRELRATVKDEVTASRLEEQMKLATLERDAQALERAAERFRSERGRDPSSLDELVGAGYVGAIPEDPFGGEYRWNGDERKVRSTANPFRFGSRAEDSTWVPSITSPGGGDQK
jgi:tetratricopeptide (TPR) repeat protein